MEQLEGRKRRTSLISLFLTFGVDNLGATIVYPIFAPLFLNPSQGLFHGDTSLAFKTAMLGIFLGAFPLSQFFFNPIVGDYADRSGRRKALLFTSFTIMVGYFLCAVSIDFLWLVPLFAARFIMGIGAANISVCLSGLADLSQTPQDKTRYFAYGSALAGVTFIFGPFIGGRLSDSTVNSFFDPALPMWIGGYFSAFNFLFIYFGFKETLSEKLLTPFDLFQGFKNLQFAFQTKRIQKLYGIYFLFFFAWNIIFLFIPAYFVQNFHITNSTIGDLCALMGICWIFGTGVVNKILSYFVRPKITLLFAFFLITATLLMIDIPHKILWAVVAVGVSTVFAGIIWPLCTSAISNAADETIQGKVMGVSQSILSFTMLLAAVVGGLFMHAHSAIPFIFAAGATFLGGLLLLVTRVT